MSRSPTKKKKLPGLSPTEENNNSPPQTLETPTSVPHIDPVPKQPAVDDSYLSMNASQLRWKVKTLIRLKNKIRKQSTIKKKERDGLRKEKSTLKRKYKKDMLNHNRALRDLSESHKSQISAIHNVNAEEIAKKDAMIHDYSMKLQELRKTTNIVR